MQIIRFAEDELNKWREKRRAKIMGSNAKSLNPLTRGADRTPAGFWKLVGEMLTIMPDDELAMNRGHRLEKTALEKVSAKLGLPFDDGLLMWLSDDSRQGVSPDGAEPCEKPTYAAEVKNLEAGKHFKYLYKARTFVGNPIDLVPNETGATFKEQCLQYFVINENLNTLYFGLHNPDTIYEEHELVIITIHRADVLELITAQNTNQKIILEQAKKIVSELTEGL